MALLGLFLLPCNFRAGAESTHAHSLMQLWADAADGQVDHHGHHHQASAQANHPLMDWLDPSAGTVAAQSVPDQDGIDVGGHDDSAPTTGVVLLLPATLTAFVAIAGSSLPALQKEQTLVGCCPSVLLPPPR